MGLFDIIGEIVSAARDWVADRVSDVVDFFSGIFGDDEYDDNSVNDVVKVEEALAEFRENLDNKASEVEERYINEGMAHFNQFAMEVNVRFPDLTDVVRNAQESAKKRLEHSIVDYAHENISENDPDFEAILKMQPSVEKRTALNKRMNSVIRKAENRFRRRLRKELEELSKNLKDRIEDRMETQEQQLQAEVQEYEAIEQQAKNGSLDLKKIEAECIPIIEASYCIEYILAHSEDDAS